MRRLSLWVWDVDECRYDSGIGQTRLYDVAESYEQAVGHGGEGIGVSYVSWAGCLPEEHAVVVVLSNRMIDISRVALPLVEAASPE